MWAPSPLASVRQMLAHAREAQELAGQHPKAALTTDRAFALCLTRLMEIVGESARRVPLDFRQKYPETDWRGFVGLRDILIHKFDAIDDDILWGIVQDELPMLLVQLEAILNAES